ncbi:hypothetical protein D3C81_1695450 [compost metagenome]
MLACAKAIFTYAQVAASAASCCAQSAVRSPNGGSSRDCQAGLCIWLFVGRSRLHPVSLFERSNRSVTQGSLQRTEQHRPLLFPGQQRGCPSPQSHPWSLYVCIGKNPRRLAVISSAQNYSAWIDQRQTCHYSHRTFLCSNRNFTRPLFSWAWPCSAPQPWRAKTCP